MGFRGVANTSKLPGLLMTLPAEDSGGVAGKKFPSMSYSSVSSTIEGLWWLTGCGDARGVGLKGTLVTARGNWLGTWEHDELGRE
jgi:hypothetical protein